MLTTHVHLITKTPSIINSNRIHTASGTRASKATSSHSLGSGARYTFDKPLPKDVIHDVIEHLEQNSHHGRHSPTQSYPNLVTQMPSSQNTPSKAPTNSWSTETNIFVTIPPDLRRPTQSSMNSNKAAVLDHYTDNSIIQNVPKPNRQHDAHFSRSHNHHRLRTNTIKRILNLQHSRPNATLDRILELTFDVQTADPVYIFVLPAIGDNDDVDDDDHYHHHKQHRMQNRTLILHRSNFAEPPVYPVISPAQRRLQRTNITRLQNLIESIDTIDPKSNKLQHRPLSPLRSSALASSASAFETGDDLLTEAESIIDEHRVITENDQTEHNFLRFMRLLNQQQSSSSSSDIVDSDNGLSSVHHADDDHNDGFSDGVFAANGDSNGIRSDDFGAWQPFNVDVPDILLSGEILTASTSSSSSGRHPAADLSTPVSWTDLGLEGWRGGIKEPGRSFQELAQRFGKFQSL